MLKINTHNLFAFVVELYIPSFMLKMNTHNIDCVRNYVISLTKIFLMAN